MPESFVHLHLLGDVLLVGVLDFGAKVFLQQGVQPNLVFVAAVPQVLGCR